MAAVTQLTSNFLGGVSRQTDDKKLDGQVVDILNGFPDPTYGLVKRQSTYFLWDLKKPGGTDAFEENELDGAYWFNAETKITVTEENKDNFPNRQVGDIVQTPYLCAIHNANIYIWNAVTGEPVNVTIDNDGYLKRPDGTFYGEGDFHHRTILDTTIICNRNVTTKMVPNTTTFTKGLVGTIRVNIIVPDEEYTVIINDTKYTYKAPKLLEDQKLKPEQVINGIKGVIPAQYNPVAYKTSVELTSTTAFTLEVEDSLSNDFMNSYQDTAQNQSLLAVPSKPERLVEIVGVRGAANDNYFLRYKEEEKIWEETVDPTVEIKFEPETMPHRLYVADDGSWKFGPIEWVDKLVGDDDSNPSPTFIGNPINSSFYYNNRLGFLSGPNVVMSQSRDVYNFFGISQLTNSAADPIDLNANSTRPVELYEVVLQPQGVLLFGTKQQFWMSDVENGVLTPTGSSIQNISSYESDKLIAPADLGTTVGFVSKSPDYSKLMIMQSQGTTVDPVVIEISQVVTGWLPSTITRMSVSPQNSFVALSGDDDNYLYIYVFYNDGQEDKMQAWCKWKMPGKVKAMTINNDIVSMVTLQGNRYVMSMLSLNTLDKSGYQLSDDPLKPGAPYLDFLSRPKSIVYDSTTRQTKFYVSFPLIAGRQGKMVLTLPSDETLTPATEEEVFTTIRALPRSVDDDPGYWRDCEQGTDATGDYFVVDGDFTEYSNGVAIGYEYEYEVILPKFYYRLSDTENSPDYTATLTVNRVRFAVGLTGAVNFKLKALGNEEWVDVQHTTAVNYYEADTDPIAAERTLTVPVNQRNKHFQLKVTSDLPFPCSLVSMMWEGQYTPRFYRRS